MFQYLFVNLLLMPFGKEIKRLRLLTNLSVREVAEKLGVSDVRLRKWEANDSVPRSDDAYAIYQATGIRVNDFHTLAEMPKFKNVPKGRKPIMQDENDFSSLVLIEVLLEEVAKLKAKAEGTQPTEALDELEKISKSRAARLLRVLK